MMQQLLASLVASVSALGGGTALAHDLPKDHGNLERPAFVQQLSPEERAEKFEERFGISQPADWADMSREDRRAWLEANVDASLLPQRPELPENWDEMSDEEKRDWKHDQRQAHFEEKYDVALPADWSELDREAKKAWIEENVPDFEPPKHQKRPHRFGQRGPQPQTR